MSETSPPLRLMPADGTVFRRVVLEELNSSLLSFSLNFDLKVVFNFFSFIFILIATAQFEMFQNIVALHIFPRSVCCV